jgi:membrane carboxypeptidase/penicillin-binding protein PbpC
LRVTGAAPGRVEWRIDGRVVGSADAARALDWPLAPGPHEITARDARGRVATTVIAVR